MHCHFSLRWGQCCAGGTVQGLCQYTPCRRLWDHSWDRLPRSLHSASQLHTGTQISWSSWTSWPLKKIKLELDIRGLENRIRKYRFDIPEDFLLLDNTKEKDELILAGDLISEGTKSYYIFQLRDALLKLSLGKYWNFQSLLCIPRLLF